MKKLIILAMLVCVGLNATPIFSVNVLANETPMVAVVYQEQKDTPNAIDGSELALINPFYFLPKH